MIHSDYFKSVDHKVKRKNYKIDKSENIFARMSCLTCQKRLIGFEPNEQHASTLMSSKSIRQLFDRYRSLLNGVATASLLSLKTFYGRSRATCTCKLVLLKYI